MNPRCPCLPAGLAFVLAISGSALADDDAARQEYLRKQIPSEVKGTYKNGELVALKVGGRNGYVVKPKGKVDPQRRWVWIFPFWLGINDGHGALHHRYYVDRFLDAGFHVAGMDVGTSCGSPSAAALSHTFYEHVSEQFKLNRKARLVVQSNGGLIGYSWAFRHPDCVDRIFGICPVTDFRTWPTLPVVLTAPAPGLGYDLSLEELTRRQAEFNPVDNLAPLAKAGVKILHVHGDKDELVPREANSLVVLERYKALGGSAALDTIAGLGHGGQVLYESRHAVAFLLGD
jgi:pimeloyl-ACP methyl ester carboxylesterase